MTRLAFFVAVLWCGTMAAGLLLDGRPEPALCWAAAAVLEAVLLLRLWRHM